MNNLPFEPKKKIKLNSLLKGDSPKLGLDEFLAFKQISQALAASPDSKPDIVKNLSLVSVDDIDRIHLNYGEEGLFKLQLLAMSSGHSDFKHFFTWIREELIFSAILPQLAGDEEIHLDNQTLLQSNLVNNVNSHILQPSFSRKIYNPGRRQGYLVYGLGGPKILISHPFQGIDGKKEAYDLYNNSVDVASSLMLRGYFGTFMFLDYLPGLNYQINGIPAWVIWFSKIAAHSDMVLFVKEYETDFGTAQKLEMDFTPDSVQKKIVNIPHTELKWAKMDTDPVDGIMYLGENGIMSQEEWYRFESQHADIFIKPYADLICPKDRFYQQREDGSVLEYPLDYQLYT